MKKHEHFEQQLDDMIRQEKGISPDPWLHSRVMAAIEKRKEQRPGYIISVLRPALVFASMLLAVWMGVQAGSSWHTEKSAAAVVLENDHDAEHFAFYTQSENE